MYVYADVIFIINMIMNCTILLLTAWMAGIQYKLWRLMVASVVGSFYVLVGGFIGIIVIYHPICKIIVSLLLVVVAFGFKTTKSILRLVAFFYIVAFVLGGTVAGWLYFWQTNTSIGSSKALFTTPSCSDLLFGSGAGILLMIIVLRCLLPRLVRHQNLYQVKIEYEGRTVQLTGMLDTGNGLYTVLGRRPVIIVNQCAIEAILSEEVVRFLRKNSPEMWLTNLDQCKDSTWIERIQVIPYHGIGSESMLLAFRPDHFMVRGKLGFVETSDVVIGIYSGALACDGEYVLLLHSQIRNELSKKEEAGICA